MMNFEKIFNFGFYILSGLRKQLVKNSSSRQFSNSILKKYLKFLGGDILNVSGWEDKDKYGNTYFYYFNRINNYTISNIHGERGMPEKRTKKYKWIYLDLEKPLPKNLKKNFDVVFCHTVLEHIFEIQIALDNLVKLSKDIIVIVVPFSQSVHDTSYYGDYFRFTPYFFKKYFESKNFQIILSSSNDQPFTSVYLVVIASQMPDKHPEFKNAPLHFDIKISPSKFGAF